MADGNSSSAYNARFCNSSLYARRAHNAREFFCRCVPAAYSAGPCVVSEPPAVVTTYVRQSMDWSGITRPRSTVPPPMPRLPPGPLGSDPLPDPWLPPKALSRAFFHNSASYFFPSHHNPFLISATASSADTTSAFIPYRNGETLVTTALLFHHLIPWLLSSSFPCNSSFLSSFPPRSPRTKTAIAFLLVTQAPFILSSP